MAREFRLRIKRWKAEQKSPADTLSFDDSDKRWLAYLRAHVGNLELLPAIVTHWERTAKPITRPLKVEELCKAFVLYREGKGLDKATLSEDRYISRRLQKHLGGYMAHELGVAEIRSFLDTAKTSDSLEHKLYKVGSLIFAHGKEQRVLEEILDLLGLFLGNSGGPGREFLYSNGERQRRGRTHHRRDAGGRLALPVRADDQIKAGLGAVGLANRGKLVGARVIERISPEAFAEVRDLEDKRLLVQRQEADTIHDRPGSHRR